MTQLIHNKNFDVNRHPQNIDDFFCYFVENRNIEDAILILPTQKWVNKAKKDFSKIYFEKKGFATTKLNFYRLEDLAKKCLYYLTTQYTFISDTMIFAFFVEAINNISDKLQYFKHKKNNSSSISPSIIQNIKQIIIGLKEDGITSEEMLKEFNDDLPVANATKRFMDFQLIYEEYERLLRDYVDITGVYNKTIELLKQNENILDGLFSKESIIFFYGFTEFKLPEAKFISNFSKSNYPILINVDHSHISDEIYERLDSDKKPDIVIRNTDILFKNVRRLVNLNYRSVDLWCLDKVTERKNAKNNCKINDIDATTYIKQSLFNESVPKQLIPALQEQFTILQADDRIEEVKQLAKLVKHLHINKGIPYNKMCVCTRTPSKYSDLFREYFSEAEIIINISDRFDLSTSNPVVFIFALLDIVANKWKSSDLERIIHYKEIDGLEQLNDIVGVPNNDKFDKIEWQIQNLIKTASKYRIFGGTSAYVWKHQLNTHRKQLYKQYEQNDGNDTKQEHIALQVSQLTKAIETINTLEKNLLKNGKYTFKEFALEIHNLIDRLKIKEYIHDRHLKLQESNAYLSTNFSVNNLATYQLLEEFEKNSKALQKFEQTLNEIINIWTERFGNVQYNFKDIVDLLKTVLNETKYQISEKNIGINITSIEQTRGMNYEVLILCGAIEEEFPLTFRSNMLLGKELPNSEHRHYINEKILFQQFLTHNEMRLNDGKMKLYISFPIKDERRNSLIKSSFIDELCSIIGVSTEDKIIDLSNAVEANKKLKWYKYIVHSSDIYFYNVHKGIDDNLLLYNNKRIASTDEYNGNNFALTERSKNYKNKLIDDWNNYGYSISKLEMYANCPFQFFIQNILKIDTENKEEEEKLSALDIGNYIHKILEIFYKINLEKHNNKVLNFSYFDIDYVAESDKIKQKYLNELIEIAKPLFRPLNIPFFKYEIKKIIDDNGLISKWIDNEISKQKEWNYNSIYFEYRFVDDVEFNNQKIKLQGKIDRIEIDKNKHFIVADYKLKKGKSLSNINEGKSLQLPIYINIVQKKLGNDFTPSGGLYYSIKANESKDYTNWAIKLKLNENIEKKIKIGLLEKEEFDNTLDKSLGYIMMYRKNIEQNKFNIATDDKNCKYCKFKQICYKQIKW